MILYLKQNEFTRTEHNSVSKASDLHKLPSVFFPPTKREKEVIQLLETLVDTVSIIQCVLLGGALRPTLLVHCSSQS